MDNIDSNSMLNNENIQKVYGGLSEFAARNASLPIIQ
jgi:hypothetical protein